MFTLQKKQRKLFAFPGNFLRVSFYDYLLLPQSELVSTLQNGVVTKRRQTLQTSFRLKLIKSFMRLLEACGNFLASCAEDFLTFFRFKVLAGTPQRVRKNTALSLLAVACMFLRRSNFLRHFLRVHNFGSVLVLYMQLLFLGTCILET